MKLLRIVTASAVAGLAALGVIAPLPAGAATIVPDPPVAMDAWAWCGVDPTLTTPAVARAAVKSMAQQAGIDATFGPCRPGSPEYTPAFTGDRYAPPATYKQLIALNAEVGMRTVVYDQRLWSDTASVRQQAIAEWQPYLPHIAAWDMGDEFPLPSTPPDPDEDEWFILIERWNLILSSVTPQTAGIRPFANHLWWAVEEALTDLSGSGNLMSFTRYGDDQGVSVATSLAARPDVSKLMCGVNAMTHVLPSTPPYVLEPTAATIYDDMQKLIRAGCNQFLIFGGFEVYADTNNDFRQTIVDPFNGAATPWARSVLSGALTTSFAASQPARLLETRTGPGLSTVDGQFFGIGAHPGDTVRELTVAGRAGVPKDADAVALNVTVDAASAPGFITVFPCGSGRPNAASLNFGRGATLSNAVVAKVGVEGKVCLYAMSTVDLVVDLTGYYPSGSSVLSQPPARILETRVGVGLNTADGLDNGIGARTGDTVTELTVAGRVGLPFDVDSVVLNVTVDATSDPGFLTVFPCGGPRPNAASLNYGRSATLSNAVITKVGTDGKVCIYTMATVDLVVDVDGYSRIGANYRPQDPARIVETRVGIGLNTADGQDNGIGARLGTTTTEVVVAGRVGVPANASSVVLNVTVDATSAPGFLTVFPCGSLIPTASSINYGQGATLSNAVQVKVGAGGKVCFYTMATIDLVVDVNGHYPAKVGALPPPPPPLPPPPPPPAV